MLSLKDLNLSTSAFRGIMSEIPLNGLTNEIQDVIKQFAAEQHAPSNFVAAALLTAYGSMIGRRVKVIDGGWENYLNLFTCLVGYSTDGKSPSCRPILKPIYAIDNDNHDSYVRELRAYNALDKEEQKHEVKPCERKIIVDNVTTEKLLHDLYKANGDIYGGILSYPDEIETLFGNLDRYSSGSSIGYYLRMWEGSTIRVDRLYDEEGKLIKEPFLSILGGIQPGTMRKVFSGFYGNGFFPRWTFVLPNRKSDRAEKNDIFHKYWAEIVEVTLENSVKDSLPKVITFSEDAISLLRSNDEYRELMSEKIKTSNSELSELIMKQNYIVRRLSGIIHILNAYSKRKVPTGKITVQEYLYAEELDEFFIRCAAIAQKQMYTERIEKMGTKELLRRLNDLHPITNITALSTALGGRPSKQYISKCLINADTTDLERHEKDANEAYPLIISFISEYCKTLNKTAGIPNLEEFCDCMMPYPDNQIKETLRKLNKAAEEGKLPSNNVYSHTFDIYARSNTGEYVDG